MANNQPLPYRYAGIIRSGRGCHARPGIYDSWAGMDRMGGTHSHHTGCIPHSDKIRWGLDTYLVWAERA